MACIMVRKCWQLINTIETIFFDKPSNVERDDIQYLNICAMHYNPAHNIFCFHIRFFFIVVFYFWLSFSYPYTSVIVVLFYDGVLSVQLCDTILDIMFEEH